MAWRVLERVERGGAYADLALHAALARSPLAGPDRALVTELVQGTLRWRGRLDFLLRHVLDRELERVEPPVRTLLRLGAYQLVFTDRIPEPAAVDQTVNAARAAGLERAVGLTNAVLRRLAREHAAIALPELVTDPVSHLVHALSLPSWLAERWLAVFGAEEAARLARASNQVPPLVVRVHARRIGPEALLAELRPRFPDARPCVFAPLGLVLGRGRPELDPAFRAGLFTVQDEGAQIPVALLDPAPGERVLDVCAAPGGKTTAVAEAIGERGEVVAVDRHPGRLALVGRDARRLGLVNVTTRHLDAALPQSDLAASGPFDRVLVDAPCSGLGTLRRNPDLRWRVQPDDLGRLAGVQTAILRNARRALRPGGTLVYSTCTITHEENEAVVETLLSETPAGTARLRLLGPNEIPAPLRPLADEAGLVRCLPHLQGTDGFFAARFEAMP
jgi:16S rRNA (cytosine967-C5)-methyltransferase